MAIASRWSTRTSLRLWLARRLRLLASKRDVYRIRRTMMFAFSSSSFFSPRPLSAICSCSGCRRIPNSGCHLCHTSGDFRMVPSPLHGTSQITLPARATHRETELNLYPAGLGWAALDCRPVVWTIGAGGTAHSGKLLSLVVCD